MKKIFFVSYGGGHIKIVDLICRQLAERADVEFRILALTTAYAQVIDRYGPARVKRISDYLELFDDSIDEILRCGLKLVGDNHNGDMGIPRIESLAYLGLCYHDLERRHGAEEADKQYARHGRQAFLPVDALRRIIEHERPDTVTATSSPRCEQAALMAGNELGLKTVGVLDLFGEVCPLPEARHVVTLNDDVVATLQGRGLEGRSYYPLGQPALEETVRRVADIDVAACKARCGIPPDKKVLLLATNRPVVFGNGRIPKRELPYEAVYDRLFEILTGLAATFDVQILLRHHPSESRSAYEPFIDRYPQVKLLNPQFDIYESVAMADYVLAGNSTVSVEAMFCGKISLTYMHDLEERFPFPRVQRPPFVFSRGFRQLEDNLRDVLEHGHEFDLEALYRPGAAENIANLLVTLSSPQGEHGNQLAVSRRAPSDSLGGNASTRDKPETERGITGGLTAAARLLKP